MTKQKLSEMLAAHPEEWFPYPPASEEEVAAAEASVGRKFPEEYRELLRACGAGALYGAKARVLLFPLGELPSFNPDPDGGPELAEMLVFGDDEGTNIYFFDPQNRLGRGEWAVFRIDKGVRSMEYAEFVARDFRGLHERVLSGKSMQHWDT